ncbi:Hypp5815 [Branchiostoma lanceolatum]|uniref:Hypp5815 protein n=1 Tax=Branchiostoma lanceolatum TaxID=7740 RepID=A0A8J9YNZ6_BRALA|nr:Hypp5815 [Branchiostoma lanceolatum]
MKLSVCVLFLGCLVLAAAFPAPREERLQGLLAELEDLVVGIGEQLEMEMDKRDQVDDDEDMLDEDEDQEAEAEEDQQEAGMERRYSPSRPGWTRGGNKWGR